MNNDNTLIVNFPSSRPSVSFAAKSYLQYIEYSTSKELRAKWYSTEEYERFKQVITRDVLVNSVKLAFYINGRHHELTAQDHIRCIGLNHLLSRDVNKQAEAVRAARKRHVRMVLEAQTRLRLENVDCVEYIARISKASSKKSRERSRKIAAFISMIEQE